MTRLEFDDPFTPTACIFSEGKERIEFMTDNESIRVMVFRDKDICMSMRIPLWASTALAQMFSNTLNGQRFIKEQP